MIRNGRQTLAIRMAGILVLFLSALCPVLSAQQETTVVVAAKTSLVRLRPSVEGEIVQRVGSGAEFKVTASSEGWVKVSLANGKEGWLPKGEIGIKVNRQGHVCVEIELSKGLKLGAIQGGFRGTGESSGDSVILRAKGTLRLEICPQFEPGSVLRNRNAGGQDMVLLSLAGIPEGDRLRLVSHLTFEPEVETEYAFEAYCLNFRKHNPSDSDDLVLSDKAPGDIQKLLGVKGFDLHPIQLAIWAVTDNVTPQEARDVFGSTDANIADARRLIERAGLIPSQYRLFTQQ